MRSLQEAIDGIAISEGFSGAVHVEREGRIELSRQHGLAHRALGVPITGGTQFALASGTKGLTAVTVASLLEEGLLDLSTTARSILGADLPLIGSEVTIEHLLAHRSGIGDYLDEEQELDLGDYLMPIPVHRLATTEDYLAVLGGHPTKFAPGERFAYCNSGYVVLALVAERRSGVPFHELVRRRVCEPAGMNDTAFLRSDELPGRAALGYLNRDGASRTNVFHLPVRGSGDGGIYSTVGDVSRFWEALYDGHLVSPHWVAEMIRPRSDLPAQSLRYGLGFWLHESSGVVLLEGCDTGVSFRSVHDPDRRLTYTIVSNTAGGAWPIAELLDELLAPEKP